MEAKGTAFDNGRVEFALTGVMDRAVARMLRVQPRSGLPNEVAPASGGRPFETPVLVSALRCTLRYLVLPLVLPLLGIATDVALGFLLALDVVAAIAIVSTLRRLWRVQHPRRWQYLTVALVLAALVSILFTADARVLLA